MTARKPPSTRAKRGDDGCMGPVAPWRGAGEAPWWSLTREDFDRDTRRYFHASSAAGARKLLADQRPDPALYGTRTDGGFFGEGFYVTTEPSSFYGRALLAVEVALDVAVLEWSSQTRPRHGYAPEAPPPWFGAMVGRLRDAAARRGRALRPGAFDDVTPGHPAFSLTSFVHEAYAYAVASGYDIFQPTPGETVILNPACVTSIYRAARSFDEAVARYSFGAYTAAAVRCGMRG